MLFGREGTEKKTKNKKTTAGTGKRWEITSYHYVAVNALSWGPRITVGSVLSVLLGTSTNQGKSATKREGRSLARFSILRCESHNIVVEYSRQMQVAMWFEVPNRRSLSSFFLLEPEGQ